MVVSGGITMLTEGLIRLEYSESGIFEDRATQCVWNRNFPKVAFTYKETEEQLEIFTSMIHLIYDKKKFSPNGLSIQVVGNFSAYGSIWHYGQDFQDLKGTARTLDEADGEIPLDREMDFLCWMTAGPSFFVKTAGSNQGPTRKKICISGDMGMGIKRP